MSLVVWLPLNGNLDNQGLSDITVTNNGATVNSAGKIGNCYSFDGNAHYLQFDKSLADLYCGDFSWALWVKPTDDTRGILISEYSSTGSSNVALELLANRNIRVYWNGAPDWQSGKTITKDTWSHVAVTRSGNILKIYINGALVATKSDATLTNRTSSSKIRIGDDYRGGTSVSFMGYLNDVRIYNHCLSEKEIKELAKGLVLHYKLDDPYIESTVNIAASVTPTANVGGWNKLTATKITDTSYHIRHATTDSQNLGYWSTFVYTLPEQYANKTLSFSIRLKNIDFANLQSNGSTSWIAIGQGNDGQYPTHIGTPTKYYTQIYENQVLSWTGSLTNSRRYLIIEFWNYSADTSGYLELDLLDIQIEQKDHPSSYSSSSRGLITKYDGKVYVEPDGSKWARIFHHNNPAGGVFTSGSNWSAGVYVDSNRWFDIYDTVNQVTSYELMIKQKTTSDATETKYRWIQYVSPLTAVYDDVAPGQVTKITTSGYTNGSGGGIYIHNANTHMNITNGTSSNWYGAVGSWTVWNNGIPGYPNTAITSGYMDLYIRVDEILSKIYDYSGYGYHGILCGNTLTVQQPSARYNYCTHWNDGSYISGPIFASGIIQSASFWIFVPSTVPSTGIAFLDRSSLLAFGYWSSGNTMIVSCTNSCKCIYSTSYLTKNAWNHIVILRPTGSAEPTLYVNGVLRTNNGNSDTWGGTASEFTIGTRTTTTPYQFIGELSDFRLYSTILSVDDILELYHTAASIDNNGNLYSYSFEET